MPLITPLAGLKERPGGNGAAFRTVAEFVAATVKLKGWPTKPTAVKAFGKTTEEALFG